MTLHSLPSLESRYRVTGHPQLRVTILDVGLACCALEVGAAITAGLLVPQESIDTESDGFVVSVLLISGTVTDALAPGIIRAWGALEDPKLAVSFGACANTGGPYWDAPTVTKGIDQLIPISVYIPGCPPRPEALVAGLVRLSQPSVVTHSDPSGESR